MSDSTIPVAPAEPFVGEPSPKKMPKKPYFVKVGYYIRNKLIDTVWVKYRSQAIGEDDSELNDFPLLEDHVPDTWVANGTMYRLECVSYEPLTEADLASVKHPLIDLSEYKW